MLSQIRYEKYVVNQNGNVILRKKLLTSSRETEDTYLRASDNKIAFKGSPLGITLDAKTVLAINGDRYASKEYTIYDISTGAKLQEFQTRTTSAQVILSHGMFYVEETGNTVIYLPGK